MDTPDTRPSIKQIAFGDLDTEISNTRRVLERIPADKLGWQPHAKSMTLGSLAYHVANLFYWGATILQTDALDFEANPPKRQAPPPGKDEVLQAFEKRVSTFRTLLENATDEQLEATWTLTRGKQVIHSAPRAAIIRSMCMNHLAHHRGQLTVYLRLNDVPVPGIFGPSADER